MGRPEPFLSPGLAIAAGLLIGLEREPPAPSKASAGSCLGADLPAFPAGSSALLVFRGDELIPARGQTVLQAGDHVYVLCRPEGRSFVHLLFGEAQES
jgi:cell volume regulation protein A